MCLYNASLKSLTTEFLRETIKYSAKKRKRFFNKMALTNTIQIKTNADSGPLV